MMQGLKDKDDTPLSLTRFILNLLGYLTAIGRNSLTIAMVVLILILWRTGSGFLGIIKTWFTPSQEMRVDVPTIIVQQVRQASELTTAIVTTETVVPSSSALKIGEFVIAETKLLYIARGEVRAGIDLTQLTPTDVTIAPGDDGTITINLPQPQILDSKVDVNNSQVYHYDRGLLGLGPDVAPELQTMAQRETLNKIVLNACDIGILNQANERAVLSLTNLLTATGHGNLDIVPTEPTPDSCVATQPN